MRTKLLLSRESARCREAMTLVESLVSVSIAVLTIGGTMNGYVLSTQRAEWSAHSLAAHSLALQRMEQVRSAKWDTAAYPQVDQVVTSNFRSITNILDVPVSGSNLILASIHTTITTVSAVPPLKMVRVDCIWPFMNRGLFTNSVMSYRAPDQ